MTMVVVAEHHVNLGEVISWFFGWIYFIAWSLSFYPQIIVNYRRRSVTGLSADYLAINIIGFAAYSLSTYLFLYSPTIRQQYAKRHPSAPEPSVQVNDLAFGVHALILSIFIWCQFSFFGFKREPHQRLGSTMYGIITGLATVTSVTGLLVSLNVGGLEGLDFVYTVGYVKILITCIKFIPQVYLNYTRESTVGWSVHNITLDFLGGALSLAQLFLDSALAGDIWGGTFGNPLKLGLAIVSLCFDCVFLCQHYVWFGDRAPLELIPEDDDSRGNRANYGATSSV